MGKRRNETIGISPMIEFNGNWNKWCKTVSTKLEEVISQQIISDDDVKLISDSLHNAMDAIDDKMAKMDQHIGLTYTPNYQKLESRFEQIQTVIDEMVLIEMSVLDSQEEIRESLSMVKILVSNK